MIAQSLTTSFAEQLLQPFWKVADTIFSGRKFFFGLGNLYSTAREIHRSFQEARSALEIGRLLHPDKLLTSFSELGIMRLLQRLEHQELEDFRLETLKPLLDFDHDGNLELEQTLLTYYLCNGDHNLAAQKLYLHPNTLRYRIRTASEVLDRDVSHINNQLNLFIALQIGRLKGLWS
jgi:DNA-binding PucR family transcriptional regulator